MMGEDINGFYAILGLDPSASQEAIGAAFRRKAKELHPDITDTGNAHAFRSLRKAYDTLYDPVMRAAYDHISQQNNKQPTSNNHIPGQLPDANRNAKAWLLASTVVSFVIGIAWFGLSRTDTNVGTALVPNERGSPSSKRLGNLSPQSERAQWDAIGTPVTSAALPKSQMYYILSADSPIPIWHKTLQGGYVQDGSIEPFTSVELLRSLPAGNIAEVRFADGSSGYMDPRSIGPGDAKTAREAYCLYKPGRLMASQKILSRTGTGPHKISVENQGNRPAIVIMRSALGKGAIAMLVAAYSTAYVDQFPSGLYRPEFLFGDQWSEKCGGVFGHRHAQRFPEFDNFEVKWLDKLNNKYEYTVMHYTITPVMNGNVHVVEIANDNFDLE